MKNLVILLILSVMFGCSESGLEPVVPPVKPPVVKKFVIEITSVNATTTPTGKFEMNEGANLDLVVTASSGCNLDSLYVNDNKILLTGKTYNYTLSNITTGYNIKVVAKKEAVVIVPTRADTICLGPWKLTKARAQKTDGSGIWEDSPLNPVLSASSLFFYLNGRYEYFYADGTRFGNGDWSLSSDGTMLTRGGKQFKIVEFTVSKMVLFYPLPCYGPTPDENGKYPLIRYVDAEDTYTR